MKIYLTIGQVCELKGVSPNAMRYYGTKRYFVPQYKNRETGYRYYSTIQRGTLDMIILCRKLEIAIDKVRILEKAGLDVIKALKLKEGEGVTTFDKRKNRDEYIFLKSMIEHYTDRKMIIRFPKLMQRTKP